MGSSIDERVLSRGRGRKRVTIKRGVRMRMFWNVAIGLALIVAIIAMVRSGEDKTPAGPKRPKYSAAELETMRQASQTAKEEARKEAQAVKDAAFDEDAITVAKQIVSEKLNAPTQAVFSDETVVEKSDPYAFVRLTVDAPNAFAVMLRERYCVIFKFTDDKREHFQKFPMGGVTTCGELPSEHDLAYMKLLLGWPGTDPARERLLAESKAAKKRHARQE